MPKIIEISALAFKRESFFTFRKDARTFINKGINNLHYDVMDGIFVKNKAFLNLEHLDWLVKLKFNIHVHLMVQDVPKYIEKLGYKKIGSVTFQCEALSVEKSVEMINYLQKKNIKCGIAIAPKTPLNPYNLLIKTSKIITVMSVQPGAGGQEYLPNSNTRLKKIRQLAKQGTIIELDGGLNQEHINSNKNDADWFVSGTYLFNNTHKYSELLKIINP